MRYWFLVMNRFFIVLFIICFQYAVGQPLQDIGDKTNLVNISASNTINNLFALYTFNAQVDSLGANGLLIAQPDSISHSIYLFDDQQLINSKDISSIFKSEFSYPVFLKLLEGQLLAVTTETVQLGADTLDLPLVYHFDLALNLIGTDTLFTNNNGISHYLAGVMLYDSAFIFSSSFFDGGWEKTLNKYDLSTKEITQTKVIPSLSSTTHPIFRVGDSSIGLLHSRFHAYTFNLYDLQLKEIFAYRSQSSPSFKYSEGFTVDKTFTFYKIFGQTFNPNYHTDTLVRISIDLESDSLLSTEIVNQSNSYKQLGRTAAYSNSTSDNEILFYTENPPISFSDEKHFLDFYELETKLKALEYSKNGNQKQNAIVSDLGFIEPSETVKLKDGFAFIGRYWDFINYPTTFKRQPFIVFLNKEGELLSAQPLNTTQRALSVFPNPAQNQLFLGTPLHHIQVVDVQGKLMLSSKGTLTNKLDVQSLPTGMYVLTGQTEEGKTVNTKFLKQ